MAYRSFPRLRAGGRSCSYARRGAPPFRAAPAPPASLRAWIRPGRSSGCGGTAADGRCSPATINAIRESILWAGDAGRGGQHDPRSAVRWSKLTVPAWSIEAAQVYYAYGTFICHARRPRPSSGRSGSQLKQLIERYFTGLQLAAVLSNATGIRKCADWPEATLLPIRPRSGRRSGAVVRQRYKPRALLMSSSTRNYPRRILPRLNGRLTAARGSVQAQTKFADQQRFAIGVSRASIRRLWYW